ncbi:MAG: YHYH protein [Pseudomonadota bacterium]
MKNRLLCIALTLALAGCGSGSSTTPQADATRLLSQVVVVNGVSTVIYPGNRSDYTVASNGSGGFTVTDLVGNGGTVTVAASQRVQFADLNLAFDTVGIPGKAYRIYRAVFNRDPDIEGLGFWIDAMDKGYGLNAVAAYFMQSLEFKSSYGLNPSNTIFVTSLYANVLHRPLDQAGFDFWVANLNNHKTDQAEVLAKFSESPENIAQVAQAIATGISYTPVSRVPANTVPGAPGAVVATAANGAATISFEAPSTTGGVPISAYTVRCSANGASVSVSAAASPVLVTGLNNDTAYTCTVTATNDVGTGASDRAVVVTPQAPPPDSAPGAPTLRSVVAAYHSAVVNFTAPTSNGGQPITLYTASCSSGVSVSSSSASKSPITVTGLSNGTQYSCSVTASSAVGVGAPSDSASVTPIDVPPQPGTGSAPSVPLIGTSFGSDSIGIIAFAVPESDGGSPISGYTAVCAAGAFSTSNAGFASPIIVTQLTNGVHYTCKVYASNGYGTSGASSTVTVTPVPPAAGSTVPGAPTIGAATGGESSASIAFGAPASSGGDPIFMYTALCSAGGVSISASASTSPILLTGMNNGTLYSCSVSAVNGVGMGASSGSVTVSPGSLGEASVPGTPTIGAGSAGIGSATVAFTAPASNGGSAVTGYTASCVGAGYTFSATGSASPITVRSLTNGTTYACSVKATNLVGSGLASAAVNVTPSASAGTLTGSVLCPYSASTFNAALGLTSEVSINCTGTSRTITGNGVPDHTTGTFPNAGNPNTIGIATVNFTNTLNPALVSSSGTAVAHTLGYANNSVKFDPSTAESYQNAGVWKIEALNQTYFAFGVDSSNAHVQPGGAYHYHGMPVEYMNKLGKGTAMTLVGFAVDGFPIYARYGYSTATDAGSAIKVMSSSYRLKSTPAAGRPSTATVPMGTFTQDYEYVAGLGDLDQCNGRTGVTPEFPAGIYHYYITDSYPYIQRCVKGTAASTGP